jgi:hypothetical protein
VPEGPRWFPERTWLTSALTPRPFLGKMSVSARPTVPGRAVHAAGAVHAVSPGTVLPLRALLLRFSCLGGTVVGGDSYRSWQRRASPSSHAVSVAGDMEEPLSRRKGAACLTSYDAFRVQVDTMVQQAFAASFPPRGSFFCCY